jgi:putative two-component system response regulator
MADNARSGAEDLVLGAQVLYVDENSINRTLAALLLKEGGAVCAPMPTLRAMMDAIARSRYDVVVLDYETAAADPEGLDMARRDPQFRDLPLIAVGAGRDQADAIGAATYVTAPLDPIQFLAAVAGARSGGHRPDREGIIGRSALLARVSGKPEAAAEILAKFIQDYAGYDTLIAEASRLGDGDKVDFLLRNLRSAASAVGADGLYRIAAEVQEDAQRGGGIREKEIAEILRRTIRGAVEFRASLLNGAPAATREPIRELAELAGTAAEGFGGTPPPGAAPLILVVDDSGANRSFLNACLRDEYRIAEAADGEEGLLAARASPAPALILLDVTMPGIDGYETCRLLKEDPRTRAIPVVFLTSLSKETDEERGLALGAVDYIRKPFSVPVLKARVRSHLDLQRYREYLETLVDERTRELRETQREVVYRLARAAEYRDNDTGAHIKRIGYYSMILAEKLGFPRSAADNLYFASSMHDVGKIGIPDHILLKPGKLSEEEWEIMRRHPSIGAGLLDGHPSELLRVASRIALTHHEKWDGTGYPSALSGEEIPMEGRVVAVCDVFDALLSERPYKRQWSYDETLDEVNRLSGKHFDPAVVRAFNDVFPEFVRIKERFAD